MYDCRYAGGAGENDRGYGRGDLGDALTHAIDAVDGAELPLDGATIVGLLRLRDRIDMQLTELVGAFDAAKLWDLDAATSMVAWLTDRAGMTVPRTRAG